MPGNAIFPLLVNFDPAEEVEPGSDLFHLSRASDMCELCSLI